jgi:hypothetical protein
MASQSSLVVSWQRIYKFHCNYSTHKVFSSQADFQLTTELRLTDSSKSKSHCDWRSVSKSWYRAPSGAHAQIFISVWQLRSCFRGASSRQRGRVCLLYVPLALASAVFLGSLPLGTCDRILLSQILHFLFVASYDSQGHGGGIRPRLHTGLTDNYCWLFLT